MAQQPISERQHFSFRRAAPTLGEATTALDLVYQAADIFREMQDRARETEVRAQSLCRAASEKVRLAEMRAETADQAHRELMVAADHKLQDAARALGEAQSRISAQADQLTAIEFRAQRAEADAREAKRALALVEEAIRKRLLNANDEHSGGSTAVASSILDKLMVTEDRSGHLRGDAVTGG
jgi:hypothetical protein